MNTIVPYNLTDTTFLLYARIDSKDRLINLELVIKHILKYFETSILLIETDSTKKIKSKEILQENVEYKFIKDLDNVLHTTKYRNYLISKCKTPYFFICDIDIIVSPKAIIESINFLKETEVDSFVLPYNGKFLNISNNLKNEYLRSNDYNFLVKNKAPLWFDYSVGGIFGGKTMQYAKNGIDNENIYGWGPDDKERYYRLKRNGVKIFRVDYPIYHLYHERSTNSKPISRHIKIENQKEYLKVFSEND